MFELRAGVTLRAVRRVHPPIPGGRGAAYHPEVPVRLTPYVLAVLAAVLLVAAGCSSNDQAPFTGNGQREARGPSIHIAISPVTAGNDAGLAGATTGATESRGDSTPSATSGTTTGSATNAPTVDATANVQPTGNAPTGPLPGGNP